MWKDLTKKVDDVEVNSIRLKSQTGVEFWKTWMRMKAVRYWR